MVSALDSGDIVLCSWARHFTPTLPLSTQVRERREREILLGEREGGVEILLVTSCY